MKIIRTLVILMVAFTFTSCEFLFGSREDDEVDDIFEQGKIDPDLVQNDVGYVPLLPFWKGFSNPIDVYVGFDEMVYVIDDNGLNILDLKGELHRTIYIPDAKEVIQDRRIHTFVAGTTEIEINGETKKLAAVYHLKNTASATGPEFVDTLIHPFCDVSRKNISFRNEDLQVAFNGLAIRPDNTLLVSRTGVINDLTSSARPDNAILFYDQNGENIGYANGLNPVSSNLKSVLGVSAIATPVAPPQTLYGMSETHDFLLAQSDPGAEIEYHVLWIKEYIDPEGGVIYGENPVMLDKDLTEATSFLYDPGKFVQPSDLFWAPDQSAYIFVTDSKNNKFYQFTTKGYEGVQPPPNSTQSKNIIVSFGQEGSGPFEFVEPSGVCYFRKTIYIADKGNNRISRYQLNTDIE